MKKEKSLQIKEKGITLIALVITIIVLLILAGISINFTVGDNGILTQAQKAKIETDEKTAKEEVKMEIVGSYDYSGKINLEILNDNLIRNLEDVLLKENGTKNQYNKLTEDNKINDLPATIKYKGVEIKIYNSIKNVANNPENYGRYVDYPIDINGDGETKKDWMIFYEDEEGNVFLKASDYVVAGGEHQCNELVEAMNKAGMTNGTSIYSAKWNSPPSNEKIEYNDECKLNSSLFKYNSCNNELGCKLETSIYSNAKCVKTLLNPKIWESFVNGNASKYGKCAIGSPTLDMWIDSWNQHLNKEDYPELYCNKSNNYGYYIGMLNNEPTASDCVISSCLGRENLLYFPHDSEIEGCYGYWLAAPSSNNGGLYQNDSGCYLVRVSFARYLGGSSNAYISYFSNINLGLCPVICLKDGVNVVLSELEENDGTITEYYELVY